MSLTALEKELLRFVKELSEACEQSVTMSNEAILSLSTSLEWLINSQKELLTGLIEFVSEEKNYEELITNLLNAGDALITAENKLKELSQD